VAQQVSSTVTPVALKVQFQVRLNMEALTASLHVKQISLQVPPPFPPHKAEEKCICRPSKPRTPLGCGGTHL
jgi:hypothetical protein